MRKWAGKCEHHGIAMGHHEELTNIRYADDLMLYVRSFPALVEMIVFGDKTMPSMQLQMQKKIADQRRVVS